MSATKDHLRAKAAAGAINPVSLVGPKVRAALATADLKTEARAKRDELRRVLNTLDAGFWDWDIPTSQVWYSDYILKLAGYNPEDIVSAENFFQIGLHPDDAPASGRSLQALVDGKIDTYRAEFRYRHKQGHWLWFESTGKAVVRSDDGLALRIFGQLTYIDHLNHQQADAAFLVDLVDAMHSASDAKVIARRLQKNRNRAGHDDGVQNRFVAIPIDHHHIARRHRVVPHHLVAGAGAIGHKEAMVGIENTRGVALGGRHRSGVVQQLAQLVHGIANVGTQHVLAKELVEHLTHGAFQKRHATRVTRAMP
jgi:PAS domain S-box-containing protein